MSTFLLRYGGRAETCYRDELLRLGWLELEDGDEGLPKLVLQPHSRVDWNQVLVEDTPTICGSYPVRSALVRKDALVRTCSSRAELSRLSPKAVVLKAPSQVASVEFPFPWYIKSPTVNNALGVHLARNLDDAHAICERVLGESPSGVVVVQEMIGGAPSASQLYLHQRRKFHARVNCVAMSSCAVYVHREVVCHVACEEYSDTASLCAHITNHVVQRKQVVYSRERNTLLLPEVFKEQSATVFTSLCDLVRILFETVLAGKTLLWPSLVPLPPLPPGSFPHPFLPATNCFEVFGLDVLFVSNGPSPPSPVLLEVNAGPALEGLALPDLCSRIIKEILELLCSGLGERGWAAPPTPSSSSGFIRVL